MSILINRLTLAASTIPTLQGFMLGGLLLLLYAGVALPLGFRSSLLRWQVIQSPATIVSTTLIAIVFPALMEEFIFRVLLLPIPSPELTDWDGQSHFLLWSAISLVVFIGSHPLNAIVFFPQRKSTFFDVTFLFLAGLLGIICTIAYFYTGSLWLPVVLHWVIVIIWLLTLGGLERL